MPSSLRCTFDSLENRSHFAAGDPVESFGVGGLVRVPKAMQTVVFVSLDQTSSGKLLLSIGNQRAKSRPVTLPGDFVRLNADGSLDRTFSGDGVLETDFDTVRAVTPLSGDRFYALGYVEDDAGVNAPTWYLARYNADGTPDRRFGDGGRVRVQTQSLRKLRNVTAHISADGVLTLWGSIASYWDNPIVARFRADGTLDPTFADGGVMALQSRTAMIGTNSAERGVAEDGSLFQIGRPVRDGQPLAHNRFVRKLRPDGTIDTAFDADGYLTARPGLKLMSLHLLGDGTLLIAAYDRLFSDNYLLRLDARTGAFVKTFGEGGVVRMRLGANGYDLRVIEQPDGKLIIGARRLNADGSIDTAFEDAAAPGWLKTLGRDGVLYGVGYSEVYATALTGNAPGPSTLSADGTLTLRGTSQPDHLSINVYAPRDVLRVVVSREGWTRTYDPNAVHRIVIEGGSGSDQIDASGPYDITLIGGAGDDRLSLRPSGAADAVVSGGAGNDTIDVTGNGIDIEGNDGDDSITAELQHSGDTDEPIYPTLIHAGRGNDKVRTYGGRGETGFAIFGDEGDDYLRSGFTSDTINGGPGRDTLRSGGGIDIFIRDDDDAE